MISEQYNQSFQKEIARLNTAQRKAVESLDGPVLVLAGPGTGKTQILSARIGNILLQTDTKPHNILCLTYTDAGTIAMRQRLLKFIGPDAYRVNIFTFHAFCNMVIQENLDHFGIRGLQPASDIEIVETLHNLIDHFAPNHLLKRFTGEVYYDTNNLRSLFEVMKKEGWSAHYIEEKAKEYIADLPNREKFIYSRKYKDKNKGDLKEDAILIEQEKMNKLCAAAREFSAYEEKMLKLRRYDYHDMILWVLDAFRNHPQLLLQYQERYHYFLVDEYQDTNGSQNEILSLLSSYWEKPNVFVVGDDDQSIFRFQGANVKNITDFTFKHKEHLEIVVLTENYRSSQHILNLASSLIKNNNERLVKHLPELSKDLLASGVNGQSTVQPVLTEYYGVLHEELATVKAIEELVAQGVDLSEVAVIYRSHRMVENIVKLLQNRNVPLNIKQRINILELPLIRNIINILSYIQEEYDRTDNAEFRLFEFMHYDFFGISPRDAAKISREIYESSRSDSKRPKWREVIGSRETLFRMGLETASKISALEDNLMYWVKEFRNMTVQELFEKILTRGGILTWVMNQPDMIHLMQVITTFFDFIKEESARRNNFSLAQLLEQLDKMIRNELVMPLDRSVHSEHGVNFITAHSSKGLEFKYVFLIGCNSTNWEKKRANQNSFSFPDTLTESDEGSKEEEERRLFYVALTRAREHLYISWSANGRNQKPQEKSSFVAELMEGNTIEVATKHLSDQEVITAQAELMMSLQAPVIELLDKGYIKKQLENYKLSVTHLNKYLKCPLSFYFENIVRVPTARSESMGFGSAVHYALEVLYTKMIEHPQKEFPSLEQFLNSFAWGMKMYHSHFTPAQMQRRMQYGEQILPPLYEKCISETNKDVLIEYALHGVEMDGIPITGKLDKVEFDNGSVTVVDYKTGKYEKAKTKLRAPTDKEVKGGDYWRQVVFYRILLDNDKRRNLTMNSGEIFFLEPDPKLGYIREKLYVTTEDIQLVKTQIHSTWSSIQNMEFDKGCGEEDCAWCNFVKHNYKMLPPELPVAEEE